MVPYEGVEINQCPFCLGVFVHEDNVRKFLIRREIGFSQRIAHMAKTYKQERNVWNNLAIKVDPKHLYHCPNSQHRPSRMLRRFYTEVYRIQIDKCIYCKYIWFDKDELEILQFLIEENQLKDRAK